MNVFKTTSSIFLTLILSFTVHFSKAQFLMDMIDTTTDIGKSVLSVSKRFDNIRMSGYIQPQF